MPIYEYECNICGNIIEKWENGSNGGMSCSKCKNVMRRIISHSTFVLKGGGWYSEGYNKKEKE